MIVDIHLTRYDELPDIPLLLDQVLLLANQALAPLAAYASRSQPEQGDEEGRPAQLTASMVNNYVKRGLVEPPVKKRYGRDQVCQLVWICMLKQTLELNDVAAFFKAGAQTASMQSAYDGFCDNVEALLGMRDEPKLPIDKLMLAAAQAVTSRLQLQRLLAKRQQENAASSSAKSTAKGRRKAPKAGKQGGGDAPQERARDAR